jgi:hypothetical protein
MAILELSNIMEQDTEIFVKVIENGREITIPLTNGLCGTSFATMEIWGKIKPIARNAVEVEINIPYSVAREWKKYNEKNYIKEE